MHLVKKACGSITLDENGKMERKKGKETKEKKTKKMYVKP